MTSPGTTSAPSGAHAREAPPPPAGWTRWAAALAALAAFQAGMLLTMVFTWLSPLDRAPRGRPPAPAVAPPAAPLAPESVVATAPEPEPAPAEPPAPATATAQSATPAPPRRPPPRPRPSPARLVEVQVLSSPPGATVKVRGVTYGVTPLSAFLPDDRRTVLTLELPGHAPAKLSFAPGGATSLQATLSEDRP